MELNGQPIRLAGPPFIVRYHPGRSIYWARLTDTSRVWRQRFNREAPTAPDVAIRARQAIVMFEATPANLQSQIASVRALIERANSTLGELR